jgi:hypothetical protein
MDIHIIKRCNAPIEDRPHPLFRGEVSSDSIDLVVRAVDQDNGDAHDAHELHRDRRADDSSEVRPRRE